MKSTNRLRAVLLAASLGAAVPLSNAVAAQSAPASVSAQGLNAGVRLNWTAADSATSYNVYEGTSAGAEAETPVLNGIAGTGVTISGLQNDTQYFFRITASGSGGESAKSVEVRAVPYLPITDAPTFSVAGGTYAAIQHVSISDDVNGAVIHYTADGSLPTESSPQYAGAITVDSSMTLRAIAVASGHSTSGVNSAVYTINPAPAVEVPVFSVLGGTYSSTQYVDITDGTKGASIYYTTDGSDPTSSSTLYTGTLPIEVKTTTTLKAIATATNYSDSPIASVTYTIKPAAASSGGAMGWDVLCGLCALLLLRHRKFKFATQSARRG